MTPPARIDRRVAIKWMLTAASSLYIVSHLDDGKRFDMVALVPKIVEAGMTERPERNREDFDAQVDYAIVPTI